MAELTLATVNGEWMSDWFVPDATPSAFTERFLRDGRAGVTEDAARRLGGLVAALEADVVALVEAPRREEDLELFVNRFVDDGSGGWHTLMDGTVDDQKIALLHRDRVSSLSLVEDSEITALIKPWKADVDGDGVLKTYRFTRRPVVARADVGGVPLDIIAVHLKSNFINGGRAKWKNPKTQPDFIRQALTNRRRIATEAMHIRSWVEDRLDDDPAAAVVVLGDLNDGPGRDHFEELYLAHNATDVVLGSPYRPERLFQDAAIDVAEAERFSVVFEDFVPVEQERSLLLDHILLSPGLLDPSNTLTRVPGSGAVQHSAWSAQLGPDPRRRDHRPTDHRPISVRLRHG